jgi:putative DeoR family transcriptional regulator (stage III sporulation protein D)
MKSSSNKKYIESRVLEIANYTLETKSDIRRSAKVFGVSKSTVHKDLSERLAKIDLKLSYEVGVILVDNKHLGQLLGGESTRKRYCKVM